MIPQAKSVAALVGEWADGVENRGLLHERFALPKAWGQPEAHKLDNAGRWSLLRIVSRGSTLLMNDAAKLRDDASRRRRRAKDEPSAGKRGEMVERAEETERQAKIAENMAKTAKRFEAPLKESDPLLQAATRNSVAFMGDVGKSFEGQVVTFEATLGSRMMVNLAGGVVENAGIALDRCFGLPLIPGSALKGISRVQALWEIYEAKGEEKLRLLRIAMLLLGYGAHDLRGDFGWAGGAQHAAEIAEEVGALDFKGCACFLPAYPTTIPTLVVDMVNPHYPDYYAARRQHAEDNESPIPNYFPAVEAGSAFGFAVLLNRVPPVAKLAATDLLKQAKEWLERAVTRKGVGAKTAAGYGWFELGRKKAPPPPTTAPSQMVAAAPASPADQLIARFKSLGTKDNFPAALPLMAALPGDTDLRRAFETLVPAHERAKLRKNNPYWQAFTSGKAGTDGQKILTRLGLKLT